MRGRSLKNVVTTRKLEGKKAAKREVDRRLATWHRGICMSEIIDSTQPKATWRRGIRFVRNY